MESGEWKGQTAEIRLQRSDCRLQRKMENGQWSMKKIRVNQFNPCSIIKITTKPERDQTTDYRDQTTEVR